MNETVLERRKEEARCAHEKRLLRQRRLSVSQTEESLIRESTVGLHGFMVLQSGQTFGEECMVIPEIGRVAQYTARVISAEAEVFAINELELARRLRQSPGTLAHLRAYMEDKARAMFRTVKRYPMWGLIDRSYADFYKRVFYEKKEEEEGRPIYGQSEHNEKIDQEARVFAMLYAAKDENQHANAHAKALAEAMVTKNMSISEMDHIKSLIALQPMAGGAMPQLENKGRYLVA